MKFGGKKTGAVNFEEEKPLVCFIDVEQPVAEFVASKVFNMSTGTAGTLVRVNNEKDKSGKWVKLNFEFPENLHEYDVVVVDLLSAKEPVAHKQFISGDAVGGKVHAIFSSYPEKVFNPRVGGFQAIGEEIDVLLKKQSIVIVFADTVEVANYRTVKVAVESKWGETHNANTSDLYDGFPECKNMVGTKLKAPEVESEYFGLVEKYFGGGQYKVVFEHPTYMKSYVRHKHSNFKPIALNERDEIVSYSHQVKEGIVLVFPQVIEKGKFLSELFNNYLSSKFPRIFSNGESFSWLDSGKFPVPGELELVGNKNKIEEEYKKNILKNEQDILAVKVSYKFLRDLLSETGDRLVDAVVEYFKWLEYDHVVNYDDENPQTLEEDLQVSHGEKLLVVEVKGLGGTSTDKACSQITKIKHRRMKQRNSFEVYGIYVVNHQRYISPDQRNNPPFTKNQIEDAESDERGLLTTYQMYQAYFMIKDGLLDKSDVREQLFNFGLISLVPSNIESLGVPIKYFMGCKVVVVDLKGCTVKVGDVVLSRKNSVYKKHKVVSLRKNDVDKDVFDEGEVGINLDGQVERNAEILVYK